MITANTSSDFVFEVFSNPYVLVFISLFSAYIMNAEIPLFSLKTKNKNLSENKVTLLFLGICALLLLFIQFEAIPVIIGFYILLSIILNKTQKARPSKESDRKSVV